MFIFKPFISRVFISLVLLATLCPFIAFSLGCAKKFESMWFIPVVFMSIFGSGVLAGMTHFDLTTRKWLRFEKFVLLFMPTVLTAATSITGLLLFVERSPDYLTPVIVGIFSSTTFMFGAYVSKKHPTIFMQKV